MILKLNDNSKAIVRTYEERDFQAIQDMNQEEGWTNLVKNTLHTKVAWENSTVAFVVETKNDELVGYIRGHTDTRISLFICEMLIDKKWRGSGVGKALLLFVHDLYPDTRIEMLANSSSRTFYEGLGYRGFYGFRKSYEE